LSVRLEGQSKEKEEERKDFHMLCIVELFKVNRVCSFGFYDCSISLP